MADAVLLEQDKAIALQEAIKTTKHLFNGESRWVRSVQNDATERTMPAYVLPTLWYPS